MSLLRGARKRPATELSAPPAAPAKPPAALFVDAHAPKASADLAMHKNKVDEVRKWLRIANECLQLDMPPTPRLLVITGPPGSGKSTVLRVLADELGYETCEWIEPRGLSWDDSSEPVPAHERSGGWDGEGEKRADPRVASFSSFLRDALRTLSLSIDTGGGSSSGSSGGGSSGSGSSGGSRRRLVLVDELAPSAGYGSTDTAARDAQVALIRRALPTARFPLALVLSTDSSNTVHHLMTSLKG